MRFATGRWAAKATALVLTVPVWVGVSPASFADDGNQGSPQMAKEIKPQGQSGDQSGSMQGGASAPQTYSFKANGTVNPDTSGGPLGAVPPLRPNPMGGAGSGAGASGGGRGERNTDEERSRDGSSGRGRSGGGASGGGSSGQDGASMTGPRTAGGAADDQDKSEPEQKPCVERHANFTIRRGGNCKE